MESGRVSTTALAAAAARAAHRLIDGDPRIFDDPLAEPLLGERAAELLGYHRKHGSHLVLAGARVQVVVRSRYTENLLASLAALGVRQYVILGAGLDSYAYRVGPEKLLSVFEVDHPATQEWKRAALRGAGIAIPPTLAFVPADAETGALPERLAEAGFDPAAPALVSWLGVTMYLSRDAIAQTLAAVGAMAPGTALVADFMLPDGLRDPDADAYVAQVSPVAAQGGEPWLSFFSPGEMTALLADSGLRTVAMSSQRDAVDQSLWDRADALRPVKLSMIAHAAVTG